MGEYGDSQHIPLEVRHLLLVRIETTVIVLVGSDPAPCQKQYRQRTVSLSHGKNETAGSFSMHAPSGKCADQ